MNNSRVLINNLSVTYDGGDSGLKDISLIIPDRQITAIIGPSGCGKTTLLRSINRMIDTADGAKVSGQILVDSDDIFAPGADVLSLRKKIGLISQRPTPLPMSIYENVAYGPKIHGEKDKKELDKIVRDSLLSVSLWSEVEDRLHSPASKLSIGQQQRLCLARSLAVKPEILLFDEPTSALDPISSRKIEDKLIGLKSDYTIVLVTHILRQAKRLADYVVFLYMGQIIEHGPTLEVFNNPKEVLTQSYIRGEIS
ncbi:MAG: phosphate ABC transporter ATP-binding protein [Dehalococcoidales bacterium]|nr:phosphate ABC transporter ATP-binding protein [Dehalococcoidales bacterium]